MRRDFLALEEAGFARREWGKLVALEAEREPAMEPFYRREVQDIEVKQRIARAATTLLRTGDVVIVDGGTTTLQLVPHLAPLAIKIITNSIAIAYSLDRQRANQNGAEVYLTGGFLYPDSFLLVGPQAKASLRAYRADWTFLSAAGANQRGITNSNELVVETEQIMIEQSKQTALLVDHSKFGKEAMTPLCGWHEITHLVTDVAPSETLFGKDGDRLKVVCG